MTIKSIASLANTMQAANLVSHNIKFAKKKSSAKDIVDMGITNIVGVSLIKTTGSLIHDL